MNLVNLIESHLTDDVTDKLSGLLGTGQAATQSAVGAAVPALLSGLSNLAASTGGAQKLISALGKFEGGSLPNLTGMLTDKPGAILEQGSNLLNSLLGGNVLSGITTELVRYTGLGSGMIQKLMGYLMPLVLGSVAGQSAGKNLNPQGLANMFAEQKANIADAFPTNFSLNSVPGLGTVSSAVKTAVGNAHQAGNSALRWMLPIGALAVLALVLWMAYNRTPTGATLPSASIPSGPGLPDLGKITNTLTGDFKSITGSLAGIKDAASASAAVPRLKEMSDKLDGMKATMDGLPSAGKAQITELIKSNLGSIDDMAAKLQWIPGAGDQIKPVVDQLMAKCASLGGLQVPQGANVSADLAGLFSTMTGALTDVKDAASANAALPKLAEVDNKLAVAKAKVAELPEGARSLLNSLLRDAIHKLKELSDKVVSISGVGDKVKPVIDSIMAKLNALTT
jgi:hypothetical protein